MSRIARARVGIRRYKDAQQDKKLKQLELRTNTALRAAKRSETLALAREKTAKAEAKAAAAERRAGAAQRKKNEKRIAEIKKIGKSFWKKMRK